MGKIHFKEGERSLNDNNLAQFLFHRIEKTPDKTYLKFLDRHITYRVLSERMAKSAYSFSQLGIKKGDTVSVMMDNSPEYLDVWFGLSAIGAIIVPINVH